MSSQDESKRKSALAFAVAGSLMIISLLFFINYTTSRNFLWFIFPSFAVLWWPLSIFLAKQRTIKIFSTVSALIIIVFLCITNYITSPSYPWFIYPVFAVLWWPLSMYLGNKCNIRLYSVIGAGIIIAFLAADNYMFSPNYPWVLYAAFPVLFWPVCIFLGRRAIQLSISLLCSLVVIAYYTTLNILIPSAFPWAIFPAYVVLWWPLAAFLVKYRRQMTFSLLGFILNLVFFITVNMVTTPNCIWFVYPVFAVMWWPLAMYFFSYKRKLVNPIS